MPTLLGNDELKNALSEFGFIKDGRVENIDGIKYDFCLSPEILKAKFKQPINATNLSDKNDLIVEPGEVVFVLSQETVCLPDNIMAILIPKRKLSHDGIMMLGGLSVDPLYEGRLLVGLYNLSSTPYPIIVGKKLIGAHFYSLNENEKSGVTKPQIKIDGFPDELVRLMQSYKPVSADSLLNAVAKLESRFESLLQEFRSKDDWFEKLQESMDRHEKNIDKILQGLEKEVEDRRNSDSHLETKMDGLKNEIKEYTKSAYKTAGMLGGIGAVVAILISVLFYIIQKLDRDTTIKPTAYPQSQTTTTNPNPQNNSGNTIDSTRH